MSTVAYIAATGVVAFLSGAALVILSVYISRRRSGDNYSAWTPEHIAYVLMRKIAAAEGKPLSDEWQTDQSGSTYADRKWMLDTFAECMEAVRDPEKRLGQTKL